MRVRRYLIAVWLMITASGCSETRVLTSPNVLILCIDTLRADHVGTYGYLRDTTPHVDRLAEMGTVFSDAIAPSPWTVPSTFSMLNSLYPFEHGAGVGGEIKNLDSGPVLDVYEHVTSLTEILQSTGYRTGLFSANPYLRGRFLRGFDHAVSSRQDAATLTDRFLNWSEKSNSSFFAHIQYIDLHIPVNPPERFAHLFPQQAPLDEKLDYARWAFLRLQDPQEPSFLNYKAHRIARYDRALRYVDEEIGRILDRLKETDRLDNTLIIVTSDHGEEFWDHIEIQKKIGGDPRKVRGAGHGHTLFQELLRVPLIVFGPGVVPQRLNFPVSLIDIPTTVLDYLDLERPVEMRGLSLKNLLTSDPPKADQNNRPLLAQGMAYGPAARSLQQDGMKLIERDDGVILLFDLGKDPAELEDLSDEEAETAANLVQQLREVLAGKTVREEDRPLELNEEALRQLRALGYIR